MRAIEPGELIEVAAQAEDVAAYERGVLEILRRQVGFDVAMFKRPHGLGTHGLIPKVEQTCRPQHWEQFKLEGAPVVSVALMQRGVAVDVDVLGMRRLERLTYYQRLMGPHGGKSTAVVCLMRRGQKAGTLALGRTGGRFGERDLEHLRSLVPVLSVCETAALAARPDSSALASRTAALTAREREVLSHLRLGHTNAQIALALGSRERTVRNQLSSIYAKLSVGSRAEAAALCAELGLFARDG